jgi:hypothetical protein
MLYEVVINTPESKTGILNTGIKAVKTKLKL